MLLPIDIKPENSIYYYGAVILETLKELDNIIDIVSLYHLYKKKKNISLNSFSLTLDWLYLIDSVKVDEGGNVILCL